MLYTIYALLIGIGVINKKSKGLFYIIQAFMIFLFIGGNTNNNDRIYYSMNYNNIANNLKAWDFEFGYQLLNYISIKLGLSYENFLFIIITISLILISITIKSFTSNISYVISLYFLYPFIWDTVQIRNFLAMAIVTFALRYIICNNKNYIKFSIFIFIASTVHVSSLFYLSLLLVRIKSVRRLFTYCIIISIGSLFCMPILMEVISKFIPIYKIEAYIGTQTSIITKVFILIYYCCLLIIVRYMVKILNKKIKENSTVIINNNGYKSFSKKIGQINLDLNAILKINIILMIGLYFLMNNLDFIRIFRNLYIINYILYSIVLLNIKGTKKYYICSIIILIFILFSFFMFTVYIPTTNIVTPLFEDNIMLN